MSCYNVELIGETDAALKKLAASASSTADAIRKAISIAAWVEETQRAGKKIFIEDETGRVREIHWR